MKEKRQYRKPRMKKIVLKTDERVLGACKAATGYPPSPGSYGCSSPPGGDCVTVVTA